MARNGRMDYKRALLLGGVEVLFRLRDPQCGGLVNGLLPDQSPSPYEWPISMGW